MKKIRCKENSDPIVNNHIETNDLEALKVGLEMARQSYREEVERYAFLEKKTHDCFKIVSLMFALLSFLGIENIDSINGFKGESRTIVVIGVALLIATAITFFWLYINVIRIRPVKMKKINKDEFYGFINQGKEVLFRKMIHQYSVNEIGYHAVNQKKAKDLHWLNITMMAFIIIPVITLFVLSLIQ